MASAELKTVKIIDLDPADDDLLSIIERFVEEARQGNGFLHLEIRKIA